MKLRSLATIFSVVPLMVVLGTSLPGVFITEDAARAVVQAQRSEDVSDLAGDIEHDGFSVASAMRNAAWSGRPGVTSDHVAYERARRDLLATTARLQSAAAAAGDTGAPVRAIVASVNAFLGVVAEANRARLRGDRDEAVAVMNGPAYDRTARRLRNGSYAFSEIARRDELAELAALHRQSETSKLLILVAVGSFALVSAVMFAYLGGTASRILALTLKTAQYHRGEPLGPRSSQRDEIGIVDNTLHDVFVERRQMDDRLSLALDQAVEASQIKSEFVATISHEIRTPMHGVIAMTDLLLQTPLDHRQREIANTINESAQALLEIVNDVLDFSKLEAQRIALEESDFDPAAILNSVVSLARATALHKPISLHASVSRHVAPVLHGDATRLRQILINVIGNAVKFTASGKVTAAMSMFADDDEHVILGVTVSDTGIGVPPEMRDALFEPFVQADGTSTRQHGGSGLGLSISRRLVELMGGSIWLGEHEGPGATFCFTVRVRRSNGAVAPASAERNALRALVVDDDEATRRMLVATLAQWGMQAAASADVDDAETQLHAAAASGSPYDVVLIDFVLPRSNGLAFAHALGRATELGPPARILISAFDAVGRRGAAAAAGCVAYVKKPIDLSELFDALAAVEPVRALRPPASPQQRSSSRILLAEDSLLIRRVAGLQLEELGVPFDIVKDGREAVTALDTCAYDLVLMDLRMPTMDGLEATRAIRAAERETGRHTVIIALTANVLEGDREACVKAGMDDFLSKPLQFEALKRAVMRWLPEGALHA